jgi:hypothetical protein
LNWRLASSMHRLAHEAAREELLLARHVRERELAHRARLLQLLGAVSISGRPLAALQVGERAPRPRAAAPRLRGAPRLVLPLEREQGRAEATSSPRLTESCSSVPANGAATRTYSPST